MRPLILTAFALLALAPALAGCDALTGPEVASTTPTANNGGYYGSGYHTAPPCDEDNGGGTLGSGTDAACEPE